MSWHNFLVWVILYVEWNWLWFNEGLFSEIIKNLRQQKLDSNVWLDHQTLHRSVTKIIKKDEIS